MSDLSLNKLFNLNILQDIQNSFSSLTGYASVITDANGMPVTLETGFTMLCSDHIRKSEHGLKKCSECIRRGALESMRTGKPYIYKCHAGLYNFSAPIMSGESFIGCIIGGQAQCEAPDDNALRSLASELNLNPDELICEAHNLPIETMESVQKAANYLYVLAKSISAMSYCNYKLIKRNKDITQNMQMKSNYISRNLIVNLKTSMVEWMNSVRNTISRFNGLNVDQLREDLKKDMEQVYYSIIKYSDDTKNSLNDVSQHNERTYNIRTLINNIASEASQACLTKDINFIYKVNDNVSEIIFGDDVNIGFIIDFILAEMINISESDELKLEILSDKLGYSEKLIIRLSLKKIYIIKQRLYEINNCLNDSNFGNTNKKGGRVDYSFIGLLVRSMSGHISITSDENNGTVFTIKLPQLSVKEKE